MRQDIGLKLLFAIRLKRCLWILLFLSLGEAGAQDQIYFRILNSHTSSGVYDASILVTVPVAGEMHTFFDITDAAGKASIVLPMLENTDSVWTSVNHINFHKVDTFFTRRNLLEGEITIRLIERSYEIEPILVETAEINPFDTIHITLDSTELLKSNKLTELLENDSRFKFENNYLTFKNKPILRIFIDQIDISGGNYINFLNQLAATDFESMEVIQFFYENPLDQYFNRPEVALRLNTRKNGKFKKTLSFDVSASQRRLNEVRVQSYLLTHNYKAYINTARHITGTSTYKPVPFSGNEYNRTNGLDDYDKIYSGKWPTPSDLPFEYYNNQRRTELLYQSGFSTGRYGKNRIAYNPAGIRGIQSISQGSKLNLVDSVYAYRVSKDYQIQNLEHRLENEFKYFKNNTYINWILKGTLPNGNFDQSEKYTGDIFEQKYDRFAQNKSHKLQSLVTVARAINPKHQFQFISDIGILNYHEDYQSHNQRNKIYFESDGQISDQINSGIFKADHSLTLKTRTSSFRYSLSLAYDYYNSNQSLHRMFESQGEPVSVMRLSEVEQNGFSVNGEIGNSILNTLLQWVVKGDLEYSRYRFGFDGVLPAHNWEVLYELALNFDARITDKYSVGTKLGWKKDWISSELIKPLNYNDGSYLLFDGLMGTPVEAYIHAGLNFSKNGVYDLFTFRLDGNYSYYLSHQTFSLHRDLLFGKRLLLFDPAEIMTLMGNFKYKVFNLPLEIHLDHQLYRIQNSFYLNDDQYENRFLQINNALKLDSRWKSYGLIGSFGYGVNLRKSIKSNNLINNTWKGNFEFLYISQDERLDAKMEYEISRYSKGRDLFHGIGIRVDYYLSKNWNIGVYGYNLFNQDHFEYQSDAMYTQYFTRYKLVPLQIGVRLHWEIW